MIEKDLVKSKKDRIQEFIGE